MSKELPIIRESKEELDIIRHDCAHVLAEATQILFPETQVTIGPAIAPEVAYLPPGFKISIN